MIEDGDGVTPANRIESIHIKGFRSLADVKIDNLPNPMLLLGINGAGKSNLMRFFEMLRSTFSPAGLPDFVARHGGAGDQLFGGRRVTPRLEIAVSFSTVLGSNSYSATLDCTDTNHLTFAKEEFNFKRPDGSGRLSYGPYPSHPESRVFLAANSRNPDPRAKAAANMLGSCATYQFHDTSSAAPIKTNWDAEQGDFTLAGVGLGGSGAGSGRGMPDRRSFGSARFARQGGRRAGAGPARGAAGRKEGMGTGARGAQSGLRMASRASPRRIMKWRFASGT